MSAAEQDPAGADPFDAVIASLNKHEVEFLMVGGWAVIYHGFNRVTDDMDIFVRRTEENSRRTVAALEDADLGCPELVPEVFMNDNGISLGEAPLKVDIISNLPGVDFDAAWARRQKDFFGPNMVNYISREDLLVNKRTVARPKDLDDARELEAGS